MIKLISIDYREDFGHEWYIQIIKTGRNIPRPFKDRCLFQASFCLDEYPSWPYIQICSGYGRLFDILITVHKVSVSLEFLSRTWKFNHCNPLSKKNSES
jgi:hypothetical protein